MKSSIKALLLCVVLGFVTMAQAVEIAGMKIDETVQASNTTLKLNGAGIRYKIRIFKVYVIGLYLPESKNTADSVLSAAGPKQINLTMLRDVSSDDMGQAFMDGVKRNTNLTDRAKMTNQFIQFGQLFSEVPVLKKGDVISMEWVPNVGTNMFVNGKKLGDTFLDVAFFNAVLKIWIGDNPVDSSLKKQLLGITK